jgi:hypothetical protein
MIGGIFLPILAAVVLVILFDRAFCWLFDAGLGILGGTVNARDDNVTARARIHVYLRQARPKIVSVLFVT